MNTGSNARLYWAVRREVWENRSLYLAPLAVAALVLAGFLISTIRLPARMRAASALSPTQQHNLVAQPYPIVAGVMMLTTLAVGVFYSLDALYGERRDRSILFWKSLLVSDLTTCSPRRSLRS
jgi:ABC-2 type transport system permease protein